MTTQTGDSKNNTFTFQNTDAKIDGLGGTDTLLFDQVNADLTSTQLLSIEILKAGKSLATTFTVNQADLIAKGSVLGSSGDDSLVLADSETTLDLRSTTLSSVEILSTANTVGATTFIVDQKDLLDKGSVVGDSTLQNGILAAAGSTLDLRSTTISNIEELKTVYSKGTTFTLDGTDLGNDELAKITGHTSGNDSLVVAAGTVNISGLTLASVETLKAGLSTSTTFTVDESQLKANGGSLASITGSAGTDELIVKGPDFDLSGTVLSSIEKLTASDNGTVSTVFTLDQADLGKAGVAITGSSAVEDEIAATGSALDLTSSTLTDVEFLSTLYSKGTTFTLTNAEVTGLDQISGNASTVGSDTLIVKSTDFNLTGVTLHDLDVLKGIATNGTAGTTFTMDEPADVKSILGTAKTDTLAVNSTSFDLSGTTLSSVEILKGLNGTTDGTIFTLDQGDLAKGGSVIGTTSTDDEILAAGSSLDLSSTTVTNVDLLKADSDGTVFTLKDKAQFTAFADINGDGDTDVLIFKTSDFDIRSGATIDQIEEIHAGVASGTTFQVTLGQIDGGGDDLQKITGSTGSDSLIVDGTDFDLSSIALSSIEKLVAGNTFGTTFRVDQGDLASKGSIIGAGTVATDTVVAAGSTLDLSSTTLTGIDELTTSFASGTQGTVFTVTNTQLSGLAISGGAGIDTVKVTTTTVDFSSTTLTSIEGVGAGSTKATTIILDDDQLKANGGVIANIEGNTGVDTLKVLGTAFDLSQTTVSSIEKLTASNNGTESTVFTLDNADLAVNGSIIGSTNTDDQIVAAGTELNLTKTTLTGVELLGANSGNDTTFTLTAAQLKALQVDGSGGDHDTLILTTSAFDISSASLTSIEALQSGVSTATTFTVKIDQLGIGGLIDAITGSKAVNDTLIVKGTDFDLSSTDVTSVEIFKTASSLATTFTVDQDDLASGGSVVGSSGTDILLTHGTELDLSSTALTSIEHIKGDNVGGTTFTLNQKDLASGGTVEGDATDVIVAADTQLDLSSTTLVSVETLQAGLSTNTTFTVDSADLAVLTDINGHSLGTDTLVVKGTTNVDLTSTTLSSIEVLSSTASAATTFTLDLDDLKELTKINGSAGNDTLTVNDTSFDLTSTTLSSIEVLKAGLSDDTTFTLTQDDLAKSGSVLGSSGNDTIAAGGSSLDLSSTTLSSIENVTISASSGAILTVTAAQLAALNVTGGTSASDTLVVAGTDFDLTSSTLTDFEALQAGSSLGTTFTLDYADVTALGAGGSITGSSSANDTLTILGTDFDLSSTSLSSVEILKAGSSGTNSTTFTLDGDDIASGGSIIGSTNAADTIKVSNSTIDLSSTTLSNIENLVAGSTDTTTFTLTQAQVNGLAITGSSNTDDTLVIAGTSYDLTSATLTSIENLKGGADGTTFTVDQADLVSGGSVTGNTGSSSTDTLIVKGTQADLSSTSIDSVETLQASGNSNTTFIVNDDDLAAQNGNNGGINLVKGGTGTDTLETADTQLDLSSTALSSVEILQAGNTNDTTFIVDQGDLAAGGSVVGNTGNDTILSANSNLDLTSTTLSSVEIIDISAEGGDVTLDQADLLTGGSVVGDGSSNAIIINGTAVDLSSTTLTSIEELETNSTLATIFTVSYDDVVGGGGTVTKITGSSSTGDAVAAGDTQLDVTGLTLSGIEKIMAGTDSDTTITVNQTILSAIGSGGSVTGGAGQDTLQSGQTQLDLSSTAVTAIEILKTTSGAGTQFIVDQSDLVFGGSVVGGGGTDTLTAAGTSLTVSNLTLTSIEVLSTKSSLGTTFTLAAGQQASLQIDGSTGNDSLVIKGTDFDTTSTTLSSIEILKAGSSSATTFTVKAGDLLSGGSVLGSTGKDTLIVDGATSIDLSSTALSSVEILQADTTDVTTFKVDQADLASGGSIIGSTSTGDAVIAAGTSLNLTSTTLTGIEVLQSANTNGTTFTVDAADLAASGSVTGAAGNDTLVIKDVAFDTTSTTLTSVEVLKAGSSLATTFTVDAGDLASGGSVIGSSGNDTLIIGGTAFDLSSTSLSSVEILQAATTDVTTFTLNQADLASGGSVVGSTSTGDVIIVVSTALDLTSTTLSDVEVLQAGSSIATTFTVDEDDLASGGSVVGSSGSDVLVGAGTSLDLTSTTLTSVETLKAGSSLATTFAVDNADLISGGSVVGSVDSDTLIIAGTDFDLSSTTLSSVEILQGGSAAGVTFTLDANDLVSGGMVIGNVGTDTLLVAGTSVDLSSTALASVEILQAATTNSTSFTVNQGDLAAGGSVVGSTSGADTLIAAAGSLDLTGTTLDDIEVIKAGTTANTSFNVDLADLVSGGSVVGNSGKDTLTVSGTDFDLTSTTLSSIEVLHAGSAAGVTFTVDADDLISGGSVLGSTGSDKLLIAGTSLDLTSTTLSSVEILEAGSASATTFKVDAGDLASGGSVVGSTADDTLIITGTAFNLSSTSLTSVEILEAGGGSSGTTFTLDANDLVSGGSVLGHSSGTDALVVAGTSVDLTSTTLSSIEVLKASSGSNTTFTVDAADLASGGSVIGSAGNDTLIVNSNTIDLSSTTLSSIELIETATPSNATTFTLGGGQGGAEIALTVNGVSDTVDFTAAYKVTDITDDASITAHMVEISSFKDGATNGDVLDLSTLTNGTPTASFDVTGYIDLVGPATLKDALNIAAVGDGSSTSKVTTFQYNGDTYVLIDKSASSSLTADDAVVKLTGTHTLTDADNFNF